MDVAGTVLRIVGKQRRVDPATLDLDAPLSALNIESVDLVEIIFDIEDELDIDIPEDESSFKLETLRDVIDGVERLVAEKQDVKAASGA